MESALPVFYFQGYKMKLSEFIEKYETPCKLALDWLEENQISDMEIAWGKCERGDWLWWTLIHTGVKANENIENLSNGFIEDCKSRADADADADAYAYAYAYAYACADADAYAYESKKQADWIHANIQNPFSK